MRVYLDFETFWESASGYTLKKLSVEEYVRDPRFEPLVLSVAFDDARSDDGTVKVFYWPESIQAALRVIPFGHPEVFTFAQNYQFDGFILSRYYGIKVANPVCNRALARWTGVSRLASESLASLNKFFGLADKFEGTVLSDGKHKKDFAPADWARFVQYCQDDTAQLREQVRRMAPFVTAEALAFIALSEKMYTEPRLQLDADLLRQYEAEIVARQERSMAELQGLFNFQSREDFLKAIRSRTDFPAMLQRLGADIPLKPSEAREKSWATSAAWLKAMAPRAALLNNFSKPELKLIARHMKNIRAGKKVPALAKNDLAFMALMEREDDAGLLCRVRAENNTSLALSRCRKFQGVAGRGTLPVPLSAFQAQTGRYTGDNTGEGGQGDALNLQNLAKRSGDKTLRRSILAPEGYALVAADSSQIEARVNAWAWCQYDLVEVFAAGRDPYAEFAADIYNVPADEIHGQATPELKRMRDTGKEAILSLGYNAGAAKFAQRCRQNKLRLGATEEEHDAKAEEIVGHYRRKYAVIKRGWRTNGQVLSALLAGESGSYGGPTGTLFSFDGRGEIFGRPCPSITLPDGYTLRYPGLAFDAETGEMFYTPYDRKLRRAERKKIYGGLLTNNLIQGLSFALVRWQMTEIAKRYPIVLNVHDEVVVLAPSAEAEAARDFLIETLRTVPPWLPGGESLPLAATGGFGRSYAEV